MKEGAGLSAGQAILTLVNQAPHANAAKVFINWFLSRDGQLNFQKALGKADDFENPDPPIERDYQYIAPPDELTCRLNPSPVDPDVSRHRKRRCGAAGTHHPCVPQPFVDALPVQGTNC